ncbi:MAG TPA: sugar phosphate isomerase/epimerase family protein [Pirellulaceae bacterium]
MASYNAAAKPAHAVFTTGSATMHWGYNSNGFRDHRLEDALTILHDLGYSSVALTLDHGPLNPFAADFRAALARVRRCLMRSGMSCVVETGARYLLDPKCKHRPTLVSPDAAERQWRVEFLKRALESAAELAADAVSFWSGAASPDESPSSSLLVDRIRGALDELVPHAERLQVPLALEPEPGMWIATTVDARSWLEWFDGHHFGLTIDIGHLVCSHEPLADVWCIARGRLKNVHIEDMHPGVHEHLPLGEGQVNFQEMFQGLAGIGYEAGVHVELSRHSHVFPEIARHSIERLEAHWAERLR